MLASFRIKLADDFQLQLNAGPFIACGVGGNVKDVILKSEIVDIGDFLGNPFVEGEGNLHRFDTGLQFGLGFEYKEFFIGAAYDLGLFDITAKNLAYNGKYRLYAAVRLITQGVTTNTRDSDNGLSESLL